MKEYEQSQKRVKELTTILVRVEHEKPLPADFLDIAAGRIYNLDSVEDVTASLIDEKALQNLIDIAYGK